MLSWPNQKLHLFLPARIFNLTWFLLQCLILKNDRDVLHCSIGAVFFMKLKTVLKCDA